MGGMNTKDGASIHVTLVAVYDTLLAMCVTLLAMHDKTGVGSV